MCTRNSTTALERSLSQMNVEDTRLGNRGVCRQQTQPGHHRTQVGAGCQVHRRKRSRSSLLSVQSSSRSGATLFCPTSTIKENQAAFKAGAIKEFERHSRLGFVTKEGFLEEVDRLRDIGFKRVTLKTGAYSMVELAMALRYSSEAKIDLLTIDGALPAVPA